jgi:putative copper resistance protein D
MRARSDAAAAPLAEMAVRRFSRCGLLVVVTLALTGVANRWHVREGRLDLGVDYDRVLLAKVALFGIMVAIAALNRWALVSRFGRSGLAPVASQLSRNIAAEQLLGAAILLAASMLGLMNPHE